MTDSRSMSSVFSGLSVRSEVPTRTMEAALTPLQDQVRIFTSLPPTIMLDAAKRQRLVSEARRVHMALARLQENAAQLETDSDLGMTAGIRHRITMDYDCAVEQSEELTSSLSQAASTGSNTVSVDRLVNSSQNILTSVTSALYAFDQTVVLRIESAGAQVTNLGERLSDIPSSEPVPLQPLQDALTALSQSVVKFSELTGARRADLKDECQRSEMDACRLTMEHCYRSLMSSVKVLLQHSGLSITRMNCLAVKDNFLEMVALMTRVAALPYDKSAWQRATPLAQDFDALETILAQAADDFTIDSKKEEMGGELCRQLDAIILHAKQVAESPRTGDRAGEQLLRSCDEAVACLATLLTIASEDEDKLTNGSIVSGGAGASSPFAGSTTSMSRPAGRRNSQREDNRMSRGSSTGVLQAVNIIEGVELLTEAVTSLRKLTQIALSQHTAAALAQMHRDRSLVDYLHESAAVRNNAKTSEYSSQLLRQVERFEEVVTSVCSISTDLPNVLRAKRSLAELRVLCPQAVAAAHVLYKHPSSKVARDNMSSFEHAWHAEVDQLMDALRSLGPSDKVKNDSSAIVLDRSRSVSMHALSGPRLTSTTVHRTSSINSFASFRQRLQQRKVQERASSPTKVSTSRDRTSMAKIDRIEV